jgi:hypothetical protein
MVTATGAGGTIVTGGTPVKTVFNAELYDTDGMVDLNAYNQGFTVKTPGLYEIESSFGVNPASGNAHLLWMLLYPSVGNPFMTTTAYAPYASGGGSGVTVVTMKGMIRLTAGDQISQSLQVRNVTGTATTVSTYNSYNSTRLGARWIAV